MKAEIFKPRSGPGLDKLFNALGSMDEIVTNVEDTRCVMFGTPAGACGEAEESFIEVVPTAVHRHDRYQGPVKLTVEGHETISDHVIVAMYKDGEWVSLEVKADTLS